MVGYTFFMANVTQTCKTCQRQFLIIEIEQKFLKDKNLPIPVDCPSCRQMRRLKLRGGERVLYKTTCQKCGKEIVVSYDPKIVPNTILCKADFEKYLAETDLIIKDPLPEV